MQLPHYLLLSAVLALTLLQPAFARTGEPPDGDAWPGAWHAIGGALNNGCNGSVTTLQSLPDGRVVIGGNFGACGNAAARNIAIYSPASGLFEQVGDGLPEGVSKIALTNDGFFVLAVRVDGLGTYLPYVAHWNGTQWTRLAEGFTGLPNDLVVHQGMPVVAGRRLEGESPKDNVLVKRWDGQAWVRLASSTETNDVVHALQVLAGDLYAGGRFSQFAGVAANSIARWNNQQWQALGDAAFPGVRVDSGARGVVYELSGSAGRLCLTGEFDFAGAAPAEDVACWNGAQFSTLGAGLLDGEGVLTTLTTDQAYYAGSVFTQPIGISLGHSSLLSWNGTAWSNLLYRGSTQLFALALGSDGLYAGGQVSQVEEFPVNNLARMGAGGWRPVGNFAGQGLPTVFATAVFQGDLYVAADFRGAGITQVSGIARWDGQSWQPVGPTGAEGVNGSALALYPTADRLYVGGNFTTAGAAAASDVASWDGQNWSAVGEPPSAGSVNTLTLHDGMLHAAGTVRSDNGRYHQVVSWDGQTWSQVGGVFSSPSGQVSVLHALAVYNGELYAGGDFRTIGFSGFVNHWNLVRWDGSQWQTVGGQFGGAAGLNNVVHDLVGTADGLFVAGAFSAAGPLSGGVPAGTEVGRIARWDGSQWHDVGGGVTDGHLVRTLAVANNRIIAGGSFSRIGGTAANHIAAWDGTRWQRLGSGTNRLVVDIATDGPDGLYVGGVFGSAGQVLSVGAARWRAETDVFFSDGFEDD